MPPSELTLRLRILGKRGKNVIVAVLVMQWWQIALMRIMRISEREGRQQQGDFPMVMVR